MKRPVSTVASLVTVLGILAACSEAAIGKDQVAALCKDKAGSSLNCSCFTDALSANLTPEQFATVAKAIDENRRFSGFIPPNAVDDEAVGATVTLAQQSCPA